MIGTDNKITLPIQIIYDFANDGVDLLIHFFNFAPQDISLHVRNLPVTRAFRIDIPQPPPTGKHLIGRIDTVKNYIAVRPGGHIADHFGMPVQRELGLFEEGSFIFIEIDKLGWIIIDKIHHRANRFDNILSHVGGSNQIFI